MLQPPTGSHADHSASIAFFAVAVAFFLGAMLWAAWRRPRHGALPLLLIVGGLIASLQESLIDRMILLWYPADAPSIAFTAVGVHQPLYMILIYGGFVGVGTYVTYAALRNGRGGRALWQIFFGVLALDAAFEIPATAGSVFRYYGDQPFQVVPDGWPAWVGFLAASAPVLAGWLVHTLWPHLQGRKRAAIVLIPPAAWGGVYFAAGWPAAIAVNSGAPPAVAWASGAATMCLATGLVATLARAAERLPTLDAAPTSAQTSSDRLRVPVSG